MKSSSTVSLAVATLICVAAAVVVYLPALAGELVWDDANALRQSAEIRSFYDIVIPPPVIPKFYYRPVVFLSYIADTALGGSDPYWFHLSSIAFHALNTLLVLFLARRWFPDDIVVAGGGALLFAVFPTHVESVAWLSGRSDLVMTTFLLAAALFHTSSSAGAPWLGAGTLLLALLSKETAVVAVILFPLLDIAAGRPLRAARLLPAAIATVAYFALRHAAVGAFLGGLSPEQSAADIGLDIVRAAGFYVVQAFAPLSLRPYYADVPAGAGYLTVGILAPLAALIGLYVLWGNTGARNRTAVASLIFWFSLTLAPTLFVIIRRSALNLVADRYLYAPSVASCIAIAWMISAGARAIGAKAAGAAVAICTAALFFAAQTRAYIPIWANDISLWTEAAAKDTNAALPLRELATALLVRGEIDEAEQAFRAALDHTPDLEGQVMIYSNLGNLYRRKSQYALAVDSFRKGIEITPHPALFHNLGMTEMALAQRASIAGEPELAMIHVRSARDAFEQALQIGRVPGADEAFFQWDPAKTHALLGQVLFSVGDRVGARRHLEEAVRLEPTGPVADMTRQYMQKVMQ